MPGTAYCLQHPVELVVVAIEAPYQQIHSLSGLVVLKQRRYKPISPILLAYAGGSLVPSWVELACTVAPLSRN